MRTISIAPTSDGEIELTQFIEATGVLNKILIAPKRVGLIVESMMRAKVGMEINEELKSRIE